jgi:NTP pyrophosphatase (non-canonical NTP hydrolase)
MIINKKYCLIDENSPCGIYLPDYDTHLVATNVDKGTMKINEIAEKNYQWVEQMGWHNKTVLEALALVASEVGEAINECRQEQPSADFAEELADIILRVLDIAHWQAIDIEKVIKAKMEKNRLQGNRGRLK